MSEANYYQGLNPLVLNMVPKECSRILEVGCANGKLGAAIKERNPGSYYVGIEKFAEAGKQAASLLDKVFIADVEGFDWSLLSGERFDCIIFADVLEHLLDPSAVLRGVLSLMTLHGNVICCLPNVSHWSIIAGLIRGEWEYTDSGVLDRTHLRFYTVKSARKLLIGCGLEVVSEAAWTTNLEIQDALVPLLQALQVNLDDFNSRSSIMQYVVKVQRKVEKVSARSWAFRSPGWEKAMPKQTMAIVVCVSGDIKLTGDFFNAIARVRSGNCAPHVLIVDDASKQGGTGYLQEAARRFPWLDHHRIESAVGVAKARNLGAGMTDADVLVFLDANSILGAGCLERMSELMEDARVGIVGPQVLCPDGSVSHAGIVFTPDAHPVHLYQSSRSDDERVHRPKELPAVTGDCLMIKRDRFERARGFSTDDPVFYSELDLCFKVREMGLKVVYQPESQVILPETGKDSSRGLREAERQASRFSFIGKWKALMIAELQSEPAFYLAGRDYRHSAD